MYEKILDYLNKISDRNKIRIEKLIDIWNTNIKMYVKDLKSIPTTIKIVSILKYKAKITFTDILKAKGIEKEHAKADMLQPEKKKRPEKKEPEKKKLCSYSFSKGELKSAVCGTKVKEGNIYCSKHKKYENVVKKEKKVLPTINHELVKWNETGRIVQTYKSLEKIKKENFIIRKHPILQKFVHKETGMVFHSHEKREVIGKIKPSDAPFWENRNEEITELTVNDVELCKSYGFPVYFEYYN